MPSTPTPWKATEYSRSGCATGKGPQQQRVDDAEGRGAGADGEGERENGGGGGDLPLHELTPAENGVGAKGIEPGDEADVAAVFALAQGRAEGAASFGGVAALGGGFGEVRCEFFIEFAVQASRAEDVGEAREQRHSQAVLRTRLTAAVTACQRDSSAPSCFLPSGVSS